MTDEKRYRTEIPNIIDDLGLDPHERALYVHYKRSCGGNDCEWIESARVTGERTKMSHTRASIARSSLVKRGLIQLIPKGNDGTAVKIVDIWELNTIFYQTKERPDVDGWTVQQLREWCQGVNNSYTSEEECKQYEHLEQGVNNSYTSVNNVYNKKEHEESIPKGSGKKPLKPAKEKPKGPMSLVREAFLESSNLPWPGLKTEQSFWWSQFGEIARIFNNDSDTAIRAIQSVINHMRNQGLSIGSPKSIVGLCRQIAAGQPLANGPPKNGQQHTRVESKVTGSVEEGFNI